MTARALSACAAIAVCLAASAQETPKPAAAPACLVPATWHSLAGGKPRALAQADILNDAVRREVVLLGEHHDDLEHHQWQLQTLASLHLLRPRMVIGFEAFPRRVQPVLGVPHQLRDLGVTGIAVLLPLAADTPCGDIEAALADAVFALPAAPREKPPPPRLGVQLEIRDKSVTIAAVTPSSLAEQSGIRGGDVVVSVAGAPVSSVASVIAQVRDQPAGTWLPIQVRRGESTIDLIIKLAPRT